MYGREVVMLYRDIEQLQFFAKEEIQDSEDIKLMTRTLIAYVMTSHTRCLRSPSLDFYN